MTMQTSPALDWLDDAAADRAARHVRRVLSPRAAEDGVIDLASNDYLGLGRHPEVVDAAVAATRRWGAGATGSRLVTGTTDEHLALEDELAEFTGKPAALVFSSGYTANLGAVVALSGRGSLIVSDGGSHASLVDACRLARARVVVVDRGDVGAVARALAERTEERALVVTDSVYSADGELAPLLALHGASRAHGAVLLVDEAHGLGVRGGSGEGGSDGRILRCAYCSRTAGPRSGCFKACEASCERCQSTCEGRHGLSRRGNPGAGCGYWSASRACPGHS